MTQQFIVFAIVALAALHVAWRAMPRRWRHAGLVRGVEALRRVGLMHSDRAERLTATAAAAAVSSGSGCGACSSCSGCGKGTPSAGPDASGMS